MVGIMSVSIDVHKPSFLHHARVFLAGPGGARAG